MAKIHFLIKKVLAAMLAINDSEDLLEINDSGDTLEI